MYLMFFALFVMASLIYEGYALILGKRTITGEFRALQANHPGPTALLLLGLGIIIGHFFWWQ